MLKLSWVKPFSGAPLLTLPTNIRLGLKMPTRDEHSSILQTLIYHDHEKFYNIGVQACVQKESPNPKTCGVCGTEMKAVELSKLASPARNNFEPWQRTFSNIETTMAFQVSVSPTLYNCRLWASQIKLHCDLRYKNILIITSDTCTKMFSGGGGGGV